MSEPEWTIVTGQDGNPYVVPKDPRDIEIASLRAQVAQARTAALKEASAIAEDYRAKWKASDSLSLRALAAADIRDRIAALRTQTTEPKP